MPGARTTFPSSVRQQAYASSVQAAEATEHVGKKNRCARQSSKIVDALKARGEVRPAFERLASHSDATVRKRAQSYLNWLDKPKVHSAPALRRSLPPYALWQCDHPPASALGRDEIAKRLRASLPEAYEQLMQLTLPAIGLWPQRRADITATASRFGGMPLAPPDWRWPMFEKEAEPLLFVGQINCAELRGLPGAELLPAAGLLAFFADYDAVDGCEPFGPIAVFH